MKAPVITMLCLAFLCFQSCEKEPWADYGDDFSITSVEKENVEGLSGFAKLKVTVRNNASYTGNCTAYIKIKRDNTIIENGSMVFNFLDAGESQVEESWFSKFKNHNEYDKAVIELHWTVDSTGYSKTYSY